jgi:hypothetical protein
MSTKPVIWVDPKACEALADPDHLSTTTTIFRNGGNVDGREAVAYVSAKRIKEILDSADAPSDLIESIRNLSFESGLP